MLQHAIMLPYYQTMNILSNNEAHYAGYSD